MKVPVPALARLCRGGIDWSVAPEGAALFDGLSPERLGAARVLKSRDAREVLDLGPEGPGGLVAKRYRVKGWAKRLVVSIAGGKGRREWRLLVEACARGLPVPAPVAFGRVRSGGLAAEEWLLVERIDGATDLATVARESELGRSLPPSAKRPLIEDLAGTIARLHDGGLAHDDLHPGNLVRGANGRVALVDLDGASLASSLSDLDRLASLAVLNRFFAQRASRTDRLRFLLRYAGDRARDREFLAWAAREVESLTRLGNIEFWERRLRRYTRENRHIARVRAGRLDGWLDRAYEGWGLVSRLADLDRWMEEGEVHKDSRSSKVVRLADPVTGRGLFVKRIHSRPAKFAASLFRPTKAIRAWRGAWRLVLCDLATPRPIAVLQERRGPFVGKQYLVTEEIAPALLLDRYVPRLCPDPRDTAGLAHVSRAARSLGRALRLLAERGLAHGDLKAANILVQETPDAPPVFHLIDLESLVPDSRGPTGAGLGRLARSFAREPRVTRTARLRFLLAYLGPFRVGREAWKSVWRRVRRDLER